MQPIDYSKSPWGEQLQQPIEQVRVGFGLRLGAIALDWVLSYIIAILVTIILSALNVKFTLMSAEELQPIFSIYKSIGISGDEIRQLFGLFQIFMFSSVVVLLAYSVIEATSGSSLGKKMLGLRIAHPDGKRGNQRLYLTRWAIKDLAKIVALLALLPALGFLETINIFIQLVLFFGCFAALGNDRMALHDKIAQTAVFRKADIH